MKMNMRNGVICLIVLILTILLTPTISAQPIAYIDPTLSDVAQSLSVIVTGTDVESATAAVEEVGGQVTSRLWLIDAVGAILPTDKLQQIATNPHILSIVGNHGVVLPSTCPEYLSFLCDVDANQAETAVKGVGADILHTTWVNNRPSRRIRGHNVTVAVIDSGVHFTPWRDYETTVLGYALPRNDRRFLGQADFVGDGTCQDWPEAGFVQNDFRQRDGYCWANRRHGSYDPYGHGTHVTGIIASNEWHSNNIIGVAPKSKILSIRVLDETGQGTYEDVIEGIQYVVDNKDTFNVHVMNLSLSGYALVPYFVDPLNRAVEAAWANDIVVLAAAGNEGPGAETVTVPGNDPYIITVGALATNDTATDWLDDTIPVWSGNGPTLDGFVKPDVLAPGKNIVSFVHHSSALAQDYPENVVSYNRFTSSGTSMSTAVASGVVALILQANEDITPDEVKFRLMFTATPAVTENDSEPEQFVYTSFMQGAGRIWAPEAALTTNLPEESKANAYMDIDSDLAHDWILLDENGEPVFDEDGNPLVDETELTYHYQGIVRRAVTDDGLFYLYYTQAPGGSELLILGAANASDMTWADQATLQNANITFLNDPNMTWLNDAWSGGMYNWSGGMYNWSGGMYNWSGGMYNWSGGMYNWSGGMYNWSGGMYNWSGGMYNWSGGMYNWSGGMYNWSGGMYNWSGGMYNWSGGMYNWSGGVYDWVDTYSDWASIILLPS